MARVFGVWGFSSFTFCVSMGSSAERQCEYHVRTYATHECEKCRQWHDEQGEYYYWNAMPHRQIIMLTGWSLRIPCDLILVLLLFGSFIPIRSFACHATVRFGQRCCWFDSFPFRNLSGYFIVYPWILDQCGCWFWFFFFSGWWIFTSTKSALLYLVATIEICIYATNSIEAAMNEGSPFWCPRPLICFSFASLHRSPFMCVFDTNFIVFFFFSRKHRKLAACHIVARTHKRTQTHKHTQYKITRSLISFSLARHDAIAALIAPDHVHSASTIETERKQKKKMRMFKSKTT